MTIALTVLCVFLSSVILWQYARMCSYRLHIEMLQQGNATRANIIAKMEAKEKRERGRPNYDKEFDVFENRMRQLGWPGARTVVWSMYEPDE